MVTVGLHQEEVKLTVGLHQEEVKVTVGFNLEEVNVCTTVLCCHLCSSLMFLLLCRQQICNQCLRYCMPMS